MPEWWTYTLADFLMFSPRTYYRLVERYNASVWPGHVAAAGIGLLIAAPALAGREDRGYGRLVVGVLALAWGWVGWAFVLERYAGINWAARWLAPLFALEAVLLGWRAARGGLDFGPRRGAWRMAGAVLVVIGFVVYPFLASLLGRGVRAAEVFGIMPDPTAIGTAGLLLLGDGPGRLPLLVVPVLWLSIAGLTLWAMGSAEGWVVALALALVLAGAAPSLAHGRAAR